MGGAKYIVQNILFKFAVDHNDFYKSDYAAAKVAGHEVKEYNDELPEFVLSSCFITLSCDRYVLRQ